tara:strand:+ start:291 stop:431 length:141 start_codon:yes stop_codon:yes gene_type:complete
MINKKRISEFLDWWVNKVEGRTLTPKEYVNIYNMFYSKFYNKNQEK